MPGKPLCYVLEWHPHLESLLLIFSQQRGVAAGRRSIHGHHLLDHQTVQIVGAARLWSSARQSAAAERLRADYGADHIAVDVDIPVRQPRSDLLAGQIDPRMHAKRQGGTVRSYPVEKPQPTAKDYVK